jgi:hypothetical protein
MPSSTIKPSKPVASADQFRWGCRYPHPLAAALDALPGQYPMWQQSEPSPCPPPSLDSHPPVYIDTLEGLQELADCLATVREFAVDLEHSDRCVHSDQRQVNNSFLFLDGFFGSRSQHTENMGLPPNQVCAWGLPGSVFA